VLDAWTSQAQLVVLEEQERLSQHFLSQMSDNCYIIADKITLSRTEKKFPAWTASSSAIKLL
jgi:hypothetical protein